MREVDSQVWLRHTLSVWSVFGVVFPFNLLHTFALFGRFTCAYSKSYTAAAVLPISIAAFALPSHISADRHIGRDSCWMQSAWEKAAKEAW